MDGMNALPGQRATSGSPLPAHVPPECVVDWDFLHVPGADEDPHLAWRRLQNGPDIVWTPHHGGHWIVTRAALIEEVQKDHEHFSHREFTLPRNLKTFRLAPIEYDPPEHGEYRRILNLAFSPRHVAQLREQSRQLAVELTEGLMARGRCEFMADYARQFPIAIFLRLVDLPLSERARFLEWAEVLARGGHHDIQVQMATFQEIFAYLKAFVMERMERRGDDVFSQIGASQVFGRAITADEAMAMAVLLFLGGLDTVASMMGFIARFLAQSPAHRRQLIANPALIPAASEELIRRFGLSNTTRLIVQDYDFHGVALKRDEMIMVPLALASTDERRWNNALEVDFARDTNGHAIFGNGPHKCPGATLARIEIGIFIEEWLKRIPDFQVTPGDHPRTATGRVNGVSYLPLSWTA